MANVSAPDVYSIVFVPADAREPNPVNVATPETGEAVAVASVVPPEFLTVAVTVVAHEVTVFPSKS